METVKNSAALRVSQRGAGSAVPSFSISCTASWDAEKQSGALYSFLMEGGQIKGATACIGLDFAVESSEGIFVQVQPCTLYRIVEEKVSGFVTVVRRNWGRVRAKIHAVLGRVRWKMVNFSPHAATVLSYAGGLRL